MLCFYKGKNQKQIKTFYPHCRRGRNLTLSRDQLCIIIRQKSENLEHEHLQADTSKNKSFQLFSYLYLSFLISLPPHCQSSFFSLSANTVSNLSLPLFKVSNLPSSLLPLPSICWFWSYLLIPGKK